MTASARFITLVIGIVIAGAILMVPRRDEMLAMLRDSNNQAQVISLLEQRLTNGENDPNLLATLSRSYADVGNHRRAIELLDRYVVHRPNDAAAYLLLADLYKKVGDVTGRIAMLEHHLALKAESPRIMELAFLYRQESRSDEELALLSRFEPELTVESGLRLRLAERLTSVGDRAGALRVLARSEGVPGAKQPVHNERERLMRADLLVATGQSAEAVLLGKQWIVQWHEPWLADRLLTVVALHGPVDDASELAEAVAVLHPEVRLFLAHELTGMGAGPVARHLLETWIKANPSASTNEIAAFLSACREQDDATIVWQTFAEVIRHSQSEDLVTRFSEAIASEFGVGSLAPFWASLPPALLQHRPLLVARLAFHEQDLDLTKQLLEMVDLPTLEVSDRRVWIDLLVAVATPQEAFELLRDRRRGGHLPFDLLSQYARLAGGLGQETEYRVALADLSRNGH